jgi:hypothetical protein
MIGLTPLQEAKERPEIAPISPCAPHCVRTQQEGSYLPISKTAITSTKETATLILDLHFENWGKEILVVSYTRCVVFCGGSPNLLTFSSSFFKWLSL